jgi:DNA ligase D-like protein (predicted 3'-phosphoesterase)
MPLEEYKRKRNFKKSPEPSPSPAKKGERLIFVVQKHSARRLHYDLRLELDGVLKSWALPHGPSFDPTQKRLAVMVEDHPIDYAGFEGVIPAGDELESIYPADFNISNTPARLARTGDIWADIMKSKRDFEAAGMRLDYP